MRNKDGNLLQFTKFHCISLCAKRKMAPFSFRISKVLLPCVSSRSWECWWERQSHSDIGSLAVPGFSLWKPEGWSLFCSLMTGLGGGLWSSILLGTHRAGSISTFTLFRTRNFKNNFIRDFLSALSFSLSGYLITFRYRTTVLILFFPFYFWAIICLVLTSHPFIELFIFNFYDPPFLFHLISMFLLYWIWETRNLIAS